MSAQTFSNGRRVGETWTEYHNGAEFVMIQKKDGSVNTGMKSTCWLCNGSGQCNFCYGKGIKMGIQCTLCAGRGFCSSCGGEGKTIHIWDIVYPKINYPYLANSQYCFVWYDNYYMCNWPSNYNSNLQSSNTSSSTNSNKNSNNTSNSDALYESYIQHYNTCVKILEDMRYNSNIYGYSDNRRRELQNNMRRIRNEVSSKGWPSIAKSYIEDWDGSR